jgi:hypothetical protein
MNLNFLEKHFRGEILTPESAGYEASRKIWNAMIDRRPAAIACCSGPADEQVSLFSPQLAISAEACI